MKTISLLSLSNKKGVEVYYPYISFFIDHIENDKSFVYVKCNHGFWDTLSSTYANNSSLNKKSTNHKIALGTFPRRRRWYRGLKKGIYLKQTKEWLKFFREYDKQPTNLYVGLSTTNGVGLTTKTNRSYDLLERLIEPNDRFFYHGGLIRHYCIMGEINELFNIIHKKKRKIHIIGPYYCKDYSSLFKGSANHIRVPYKNGANQIDRILNQLKKDAKENDVVFCSFGQSEVLLVDYCLKNNITLIGAGRAFDYLLVSAGKAKNSWKKDQIWLKGIPLKIKKEKWTKIIKQERNK